jgi:hypothetical protein
MSICVIEDAEIVFTLLYCSIILYCVHLTLNSTFCRLCATSVKILSFSLYCHNVFRSNQPSSDVQNVVMKESAAHCTAVLILLSNFVGLILGHVG